MVTVEDLLQSVDYTINNEGKINSFQRLFRNGICLLEYFTNPVNEIFVGLYNYRKQKCFLLCGCLSQSIISCVRSVIFFDSYAAFKEKWTSCEYYNFFIYHADEFKEKLMQNINKQYFHKKRPTAFAMWRIFNENIRFKTRRLGNGRYEIIISNWKRMLGARTLLIDSVPEDWITYEDVIGFIKNCTIK